MGLWFYDLIYTNSVLFSKTFFFIFFENNFLRGIAFFLLLFFCTLEWNTLSPSISNEPKFAHSTKEITRRCLKVTPAFPLISPISPPRPLWQTRLLGHGCSTLSAAPLSLALLRRDKMALAGTDSDRTSDSLHRTLVSKSLSSSRSFSAFFLVHFWRGIFRSPSSFSTVLSASYLCGHVCYSGVLRHFLEHQHLTKADREVLTRTLFIAIHHIINNKISLVVFLYFNSIIWL